MRLDEPQSQPCGEDALPTGQFCALGRGFRACNIHQRLSTPKTSESMQIPFVAFQIAAVYSKFALKMFSTLTLPELLLGLRNN